MSNISKKRSITPYVKFITKLYKFNYVFSLSDGSIREGVTNSWFSTIHTNMYVEVARDIMEKERFWIENNYCIATRHIVAIKLTVSEEKEIKHVEFPHSFTGVENQWYRDDEILTDADGITHLKAKRY